jgi:hypothetical protein
VEETVMLEGVFLPTLTATAGEVRLAKFCNVPFALGANWAEMEC